MMGLSPSELIFQKRENELLSTFFNSITGGSGGTRRYLTSKRSFYLFKRLISGFSMRVVSGNHYFQKLNQGWKQMFPLNVLPPEILAVLCSQTVAA